MSDDYKSRLTFEISDEQRARVDRMFPHYGMIRAVMSPILDDLLDLLEARGLIVAGLIIDRAVKPKEIIPVLKQADKRSKRR